MKRKIVRIDETLCDGCGLCAQACAEGAIRIEHGKAKLVSDSYCDGLGACLGECPQGAITIEEREAAAFDEEAARHAAASPAPATLPCGCPGTMARTLTPKAASPAGRTGQPSRLGQWPVQLSLVPPAAPWLAGAEILLAADCVPFAYGDFHEDLLRGRALLVACPKLDDADAHLEKLTQLLAAARPKRLLVARMEVPCCRGLLRLAEEAVRRAGVATEIAEAVIGIEGHRLAAPAPGA